MNKKVISRLISKIVELSEKETCPECGSKWIWLEEIKMKEEEFILIFECDSCGKWFIHKVEK